MKKCNKCLVEKPYTEFHKQAINKDGHRGDCKVCHNSNKRRNPAKQAEWYQNNKAIHWQKMIFRTYGITAIEYGNMWVAQDGKCAICKEKSVKKRLAVDHDHETGKVRGLLCDKCNRGLGLFNDNTDKLTSAINYLEGDLK